MKTTIERSIELPDEFFAGVLTDMLIQDYEREKQAIARLKIKPTLKDYEKEDLKNSRKIAKACKRILKYYGVEV